MSNLFTHGHQQLLGVQSSGLSTAWRRAAEDAARQAAHPDGATAAPKPRRGYKLASIAAMVVLVTVLASTGLEASHEAAPSARSSQG